MSDPDDPTSDKKPRPSELESGSSAKSSDAGESGQTGGAAAEFHKSKIRYQFIVDKLVIGPGGLDSLSAQVEIGSKDTDGLPEDGGEREARREKKKVREDSRRKYRFDDPTEPFPRLAGAPRYRFEEADLSQWSHRLEEHSLIAVRSPNDEITAAAVQALLGVPWLGGHQRRLLAFGVKNQKRSADLFLDNLVGQPLGEPNRPTILVVEPYGAQAFFESTLGGEFDAKRMSEALKVEKLFVVIQIAARYRTELETKFDRFHFPCWDIDFIRPLLYKHQPEGKVESFFLRIAELRARRRWGRPEDDLHLFEVLEPLLSGETSLLEEALKPGEEGLARPKSVSAVEVFKTRVPIYQSILVCAAFFRGLDVNEFAQVVFRLVGSESVFLQEGELSPSGKPSMTTKEQKLKAAWPRVADDIFEACGLTIRTIGGRSSVAFSAPGERVAFQAYVRNSVYFSSMGEALWQAGHLFDRASSQELVDGAVNIFTEALAHHKEWQRPQWLTETLLAHLSNGSSEDLIEVLRKIASDSLVLSRTSQLLRALVGHEDYPDLVPQWLDNLLARRGHQPALQLAMHLRYAEGFDYIFWLKRFTDESPDDVRNDAYTALYRHARQSTVQIWGFFRTLKKWLPDPERPFNALSNSNSFALQLVIEYTLDTAEAVTPGQWGSWPSHYPLFRGLAQNGESSDEQLSMLVSWLFRPAIETVFRQNPGILAWLVRARLLELWSLILLGLDSEKTHPEAKDTYEKLLKLYCGSSDREGRNLLLRGWRSSRELLKADRRKGDRQHSEHLAQCIRVSSRLESDFKQLSDGRRGRAGRSKRA